MKHGCARIREAQTEIGADLEDMKGLSLEEKLEEYKDEQHLTSMARYLGRWQAMAVSSGEFCGHLDQPLRFARYAHTQSNTRRRAAQLGGFGASFGPRIHENTGQIDGGWKSTYWRPS